jgi:hypothetical protein
MMAEVFATMFQDEALVVTSILQSAGIHAEIAGEHLIEVYPLFFPESGGIKILVPDDQEEDAAVMVAEYLARKASGPSIPCP